MLIDDSYPKDLKKIYHAINKSKSNLIEECKDGITMAYQKAKEKDGLKTILMIRNPNAEQEIVLSEEKPKHGKNAIILTALSLLPEIISIITK